MSSRERTGFKGYLKIFCLGALLYLAAVLPFVIYRGGLFFYYGDYNVQQVPFYILAHRAVRSGNLFWNWNVDLGSSMGGSFAFYLWGSPFFWFSCLFPEKWIPYMMPLFMSLKYGTAMCTSYAWLRGFVRTDRAALLGALLYSFSGFQACNIVFQHFHEAVAFFPLYLLSFDRFHANFRALIERKEQRLQMRRSGMGFVLMTALMSVINYFFFYGQVIFIIIYYIIRYVIGDRQRLRDTLKEALQLVLSGCLGLALSAFFLIQVYDVVAGNSRLSDMLLGYDMVAYSEQTTPLAILKSMFMVPDIIGRGSLFTNEQVKNSSLSMFLPCFAISGAFAWIKSRERTWQKRLLLTCLVIMFVPILNAAFALFNSEYYARWFYMPLLFLSLVTVLELEDCDRKNLLSGAVLTIVMDAVLIACAVLPSAIDTDEDAVNTGIALSDTVQIFGIMDHPELFDVEALATCLMLPALLWIVSTQPRARLVAADTEGFADDSDYSSEIEHFTETGRPADTNDYADTSHFTDAHSDERGTSGLSGRNQSFPGKFSYENSGHQENNRTGGPADTEVYSSPAAGDAAGSDSRRRHWVITRPVFTREYGLITKSAFVLVLLCCLLTQMAVLYNGSSLISNGGAHKWRQQMLENVPEIPGYEDYDFQRIETDGTSTNYEMVWGMPTIHAFESTVSPGIFRFYHGIGYNRTVDSKLNFTHNGARAILSDRYYLDNNSVSHERTYESEGGLIGFTKVGESDGYDIYQNEHYIPMGFTFSSCMTEDAYSSITDRTASDRLLVKNIILSHEDLRRFRHLFPEGSEGQDTDIHQMAMSEREYESYCDERAASACTSFVTTKSGFRAVTSDLPSENLVFFSVPYDKGWTAYVDGQEAEIIQADYGLSAVDVPAGEHEIVFTFLPWGLRPAICISIVAAIIIIMLCVRKRGTTSR